MAAVGDSQKTDGTETGISEQGQRQEEFGTGNRKTGTCEKWTCSRDSLVAYMR